MIDWAAMKTEYVTTDTSYRRLGDKYGIHFKRIARVAKKENWVEARRTWRTTHPSAAGGRWSPQAAASGERHSCNSHPADAVSGGHCCGYSEDVLAQRSKPTAAKAVTDGLPLAALRQAADNLSALLEQVTSRTDVFYSAGELNARTMQQTVSALKDLTAIARNLYDIPAGKEAESLAAESTRCGVIEIGATHPSAPSGRCSEDVLAQRSAIHNAR